jgi:plasmid stabilization system protein ParE
MTRYRLQRTARQDLRDIYRYVALDNPPAAARLLGRFYDHFRFLAANPLAGELRTDIGPTVPLFSVGNYVIVYRPDKQGVVIAHVVHGARDLNALLAPPT